MQGELAHVPRERRTALGTQAAVQTQILVLDHHSARLLEIARDVDELLVDVSRGREATYGGTV